MRPWKHGLRLWKASSRDIPHITEMAARFHEAAEASWPWSANAFVGAMIPIVRNGHVTVSDGGFMAGVMQPHILNPHWVVAHELLWWAEDGTGPAHYRAFREWASDANEIKWSCRAEDDRTARFYRRFARPDAHYFSEVLPCA